MTVENSPATSAVPTVHDQDHVLELTVHNLPSPTTLPAERTRMGRIKMLLVLLICASPVIASYVTYYFIRPNSFHSYGELIAGQPGLPSAQAEVLSGPQTGTTLDLPHLKGQWLLLSVADAACDPACEKHLFLQRQMRESLGAEKGRVDWVWLVPDTQALPERLKPALTEATVLRVKPEVLQTWLAPAAEHRLADHLYLVDPMGHWMMRFPANLDLADAGQAKLAKKDLDRLLRASASWDTEGR